MVPRKLQSFPTPPRHVSAGIQCLSCELFFTSNGRDHLISVHFALGILSLWSQKNDSASENFWKANLCAANSFLWLRNHGRYFRLFAHQVLTNDEAGDSKEKVFVGAIDNGTTSSRFLIFDSNGEPVAQHQIEFEQIYPESG